MKQEMMKWQWHQQDHMWALAPHSSQITTPAPHRSAFTGQMPFLMLNQQHQSTESMKL